MVYYYVILTAKLPGYFSSAIYAITIKIYTQDLSNDIFFSFLFIILWPVLPFLPLIIFAL